MPSSGPVAPRAVIASPSDVAPAGQIVLDAAAPPDRAVFVASASSSGSPFASSATRVGSQGAGVASAVFPRAARLLSPAEFDRCLRRPAFHRGGAFALHLGRVESTDVEPIWRLGLVIPKRYEASAVARNTIKRRWRDAFRRGRVAWAGEFGGVDCVVRLQAPLVPKAARAKGRAVAASADAPVALPARVRARDRFDPVALFADAIERLRRRGGRVALAPLVSHDAS